jgi:hypothetical protein
MYAFLDIEVLPVEIDTGALISVQKICRVVDRRALFSLLYRLAKV